MSSRYIFPRFISGNRGDLASRWGVLRAFHMLDIQDVTVFRQFPGDVPALPYQQLPYGRVRNLLPGGAGWQALRRADTVVWSVGLDMQDDSSLAKLVYLLAVFRLYRQMGLRIWCLFQGAGPITTLAGFKLGAAVLKTINLFVARDPGTYRLIGEMYPAGKRLLAHDAIFLPGFEADTHLATVAAQAGLDSLFHTDGRPVVGLNIRQWFHFASRLLPYQFAQHTYEHQSAAHMQQVITATQQLVCQLRTLYQARILLLSAYQKDVVPWEDDLPWLHQVKAGFADDQEVMLLDYPLTLPIYFALMSRLHIMIGMRLHSTLIALRLGVPAINLSYTLKGNAILHALGLSGYVVDLAQFLASPDSILERVANMLDNDVNVRELVAQANAEAIASNMATLQALL